VNTYRIAVVCETLEIKANTREQAEEAYARFYEWQDCKICKLSFNGACEHLIHEEDVYHITERISPPESHGGFLGRLETKNYEFTTYQETVREVLTALKSIWESHATDTGASLTWELLEDSVTIVPLQLGDTLTDCNQCENLAHN
jgi:hypothetical protein